MFQTYRELLRLSEGVGFRVHIIDKASLAAKKYGPRSNKKYGKKVKNVLTEEEEEELNWISFSLCLNLVFL